MSSHNPVRAFESYLDQAGEALISASPHHACALLSKAVSQFELVLSNPGIVTVATITGMQSQIRNLSKFASDGERLTSTWLEAIAPAAQMQRSGGVDIYG